MIKVKTSRLEGQLIKSPKKDVSRFFFQAEFESAFAILEYFFGFGSFFGVDIDQYAQSARSNGLSAQNHAIFWQKRHAK